MGEAANSDFIFLPALGVGDPSECRGGVAFPPSFGPPKRQGTPTVTAVSTARGPQGWGRPKRGHKCDVTLAFSVVLNAKRGEEKKWNWPPHRGGGGCMPLVDIFDSLGIDLAQSIQAALQKWRRAGMHAMLHTAPQTASKRNCTYVAIATVLWLMGMSATHWGNPPNPSHLPGEACNARKFLAGKAG